MARRLRAPARTTLARARVVFGVPSALVLAGVLLSQSIVEIVLDHLTTWQSTLAWVGVWTVIALVAFDRWNRDLSGTIASTLGQSGQERLAARRGLVVVCGLDSDRPGSPTAKLLAACPNVEYLALIGTPETQMLGVAHRVVGELAPSMGVVMPATHVRVLEQGNNAQSVADFEQATTDAIGWMLRHGLDPDDIVVDTSCGRRAMGYGALIAAENHAVEVQYLACAWDPTTNTPVTGKEMFKVVRQHR